MYGKFGFKKLEFDRLEFYEMEAVKFVVNFLKFI